MKSVTALSFVAVLLAAAGPAGAQYGPRTRFEPYPLHSGRHANFGGEALVQYREWVQSSGAPWIELHFGDCHLGQSSFLILTSMKDGGRQRLDAISLSESYYTSAAFTGDTVEMALFVAPGERDIFVTVEGVTVSDEVGGDPEPGTRSLCDDDDDRTPSFDPRAGRLSASHCTGWLIANNAVLTAGHCVPEGTISGSIDFNVPPSLPDGRTMPSDPTDRYPIDPSSLVFENDGEGHDWAIFTLNANSTTGLLAHDVQGFFKVTTIVPSDGSTLRRTGYGLDNSPPGTGGPAAACCPVDGETCEFNCNSSSTTQQTDTGPLDDLDGSRIEHKVDSLPGNSGCPIIREDSGFTIGIHTHGGCDSLGSDFDNGGTWFGYAPLFFAVNGFTPAGTVFVDVASPDTVEIGDVLRPFDTVVEAVAAVPSGGTIRIFAGSYTAAAGNTLTAGDDGRAMRLESMLGSVVIGN